MYQSMRTWYDITLLQHDNRQTLLIICVRLGGGKSTIYTGARMMLAIPRSGLASTICHPVPSTSSIHAPIVRSLPLSMFIT
jgi:hypothetical protein